MQLVRARDALLHATDPDRAISKGDVVDADERDLATAQAVTVDEVEQQPISKILSRDRGEEPFDLLFRYVAYAGRARRGDVTLFRHEAGEFDSFQHFRESGRRGWGASAVWRTAVRCARACAAIVVFMVPVTTQAASALPADSDDRQGAQQWLDDGMQAQQLPIATATDPTASCYPLTRPKTRRRAVGKGGPPCASNPTVRLTVEPMVCEGDRVRVAWQASDSTARVHLQGVACDLPASGSTMVTVREATTFHAIATTCGIGPEASATVAIEPRPEITSFTGKHAMLVPNGITSLQFTYEHGTSWSIEGAESFQNDPLGGASPFGGAARVYFASVPAEPVLTVVGRCGAAVMPLSIPRCTGERPEVDIGQAYSRAALGQQQRWTFLAGPTITRWWLETENGRFIPSSGVRPANGEIETVYEPARGGEATFTLYGDSACGIVGIATTQTVWNCAQPLIQSFTAGQTTLAVGQSTYVSYVTQDQHSEVGSVASSIGNAVGGPVHSPPETQHTYTATHAGTDTVTLTVQTPCGAATASLQISIH